MGTLLSSAISLLGTLIIPFRDLIIFFLSPAGAIGVFIGYLLYVRTFAYILFRQSLIPCKTGTSFTDEEN
jgi:hypothetical protein